MAKNRQENTARQELPQDLQGKLQKAQEELNAVLMQQKCCITEEMGANMSVLLRDMEHRFEVDGKTPRFVSSGQFVHQKKRNGDMIADARSACPTDRLMAHLVHDLGLEPEEDFRIIPCYALASYRKTRKAIMIEADDRAKKAEERAKKALEEKGRVGELFGNFKKNRPDASAASGENPSEVVDSVVEADDVKESSSSTKDPDPAVAKALEKAKEAGTGIFAKMSALVK